MSAPATIRAAFVAKAKTVTGISEAIGHEPGDEGLPKIPCVTMLFRGAPIVGESTGFDEIAWTWDVHLYVQLGPSDYEQAQLKLEELVPALLAKFRSETTLGGVCEQSRLVDEDERPEFDHDEGWVRKPLVFRAVTSEPN